MTKINIYSVDGQAQEKIDLPAVFKTPYRPDIIKKSFNVVHSNQRQPYGADPMAGKRHAVESVGKGRGMSRVPRLTQGNAAALAPCVVGGRRAHPPKAEKNWKEKINKKEKILARNSALAATANKDLVTQRGHRFESTVTLPVVLDDSFEKITKTKDVITVFQKLGIYADVERAIHGKHIRAGRGKMRGRKYRIPKSVLIVATNKELEKSARNLSGVDITTPASLDIEDLAPGGTAGRLTVFTKSAFSMFGGKK
ncbi:MAG: 50S ribosomal protein L4 [Candidatus Thermoplasmatota archaeon]